MMISRQMYVYPDEVPDELMQLRYEANPPYYKYTKKIHAEKLFDGDCIKIGTLYDYTDTEKYSNGIVDLHEGYYGRNPEKFRKLDISTFEFVTAMNSYIFCVSSVFDVNLYKEFDADFCYRINDNRFFSEISKSLIDNCDLCKLRPVNYINKFSWGYTPDTDENATFIKHDSFKIQAETRAIWQPYDKPKMLFSDLDTAMDMTADESNEYFSRPDAFEKLVQDKYFQKIFAAERRRIEPKLVPVADAARHCSPMGKI